MAAPRFGNGGVAAGAVTRRAAAQKSSRLSAGQPESSPGPESDVEQNRDVSFGEPSSTKSAVKVTYGWKRKAKQTTSTHALETDATSSSKSSKKLFPAVESTDKLLSRAVGGGRGTRHNGRTSSISLDLSVEHDTVASLDPDVNLLREDSEFAKPSSRSNVSGSENLDADAKASIPSFSGNGKGPRKRLLSQSSVGEGRSSLTPVSSSPPSDARKFPPTSNIAPKFARQILRTQSHVVAFPSQRGHQVIGQSRSVDDLFAPLDSSDDDGSDDFDPEDIVWVSINLEGKLADCGEETSEDTVWWPAKVELPKPLMRVSLYGHPPGMDTDRRINIKHPSPSNVRSMKLDDKIRFDESNYRPSQPEPLRVSPRKKRKTELLTAWQEARDLMLRAEEDEALSVMSLLFPSDNGTARNRSGGKGKAKATEAEPYEDLSFSGPRHQWRAPSANPLLEIPGELILAKEGKTLTQYWPAKILEYVKPTNPLRRPKYKVLFFDGTIADIDEGWFYTTTDDEFTTCKIGQSTGNYGLDHDNDHFDESEGVDDFSRPFAREEEATLRAPSPLPALPAPSPLDIMYQLDIAEEFEYIKPVLAAVIDNKYEPTRKQHEAFMRGGGARQRVLDAVPLRGSLSAKQKEEVAYLVRSWAWRRERRREMGLSVDYPPEKLYLSAHDRAAEAASGAHEGDGERRTPSDGGTELVVTSDVEAPPPSVVLTEAGTDDEKEADVRQDLMEHKVSADACDRSQKLLAELTNDVQSDVPQDAIDVNKAAGLPGAPKDVSVQLGNAGAIVTEHDKDAADAATPPAPGTSFHDLDTLDKITYCNSVLLQEAILQMLLWRTGHRREPGLLSPQEEQRLHDIAMIEGEKTNWVHDIIRLRQAAGKTMLPSTKSKAKTKEKAKGKARDATAPASTRSRTRRGA